MEARGEAQKWQAEAEVLETHGREAERHLASLERRSEQALAEAQRRAAGLTEWLEATQSALQQHEAAAVESAKDRCTLQLTGEALTERLRVAGVQEGELREQCARAEERGQALQESVRTLTLSCTSERKHAADSFEASQSRETRLTESTTALEKQVKTLKLEATARVAALQTQRHEQVAALVTEVSNA